MTDPMTVPTKTQLRAIGAPFVAPGPSGVAIRDRLKGLTGRGREGAASGG